MCGRYYIDQNGSRELGFAPAEVFPGQTAPVIVNSGKGEDLTMMKWGFPRTGGGGLVINSRSEKAHITNMFRRAVRERRCLIPMSGFFEWRRSPSGSKTKEKFLFQTQAAHTDGKLMYAAGLWGDFLVNTENRFTGFVILTRDADEQMRPYHDRMPVILDKQNQKHWLFAPSDTPYEVFMQMFLPQNLVITAADREHP